MPTPGSTNSTISAMAEFIATEPKSERQIIETAL